MFVSRRLVTFAQVSSRGPLPTIRVIPSPSTPASPQSPGVKHLLAIGRNLTAERVVGFQEGETVTPGQAFADRPPLLRGQRGSNEKAPTKNVDRDSASTALPRHRLQQ